MYIHMHTTWIKMRKSQTYTECNKYAAQKYMQCNSIHIK